MRVLSLRFPTRLNLGSQTYRPLGQRLEAALLQKPTSPRKVIQTLKFRGIPTTQLAPACSLAPEAHTRAASPLLPPSLHDLQNTGSGQQLNASVNIGEL